MCAYIFSIGSIILFSGHFIVIQANWFSAHDADSIKIPPERSDAQVEQKENNWRCGDFRIFHIKIAAAQHGGFGSRKAFVNDTFTTTVDVYWESLKSGIRFADIQPKLSKNYDFEEPRANIKFGVVASPNIVI